MSTQKRTIGVSGVFVTLVGLVIGISIYILPGSLASTVGPAVIVSYALAAVMALFGCVVAAQIGAMFPISGASFFAISSLLSPIIGFITVWFMVGAAAVAIALIAYVFSDYFIALWPIVDRKVLAFSIVIILGSLNLFGTKETVSLQAFMVFLFMVALIIFGLIGAVNIDTQLLKPFMPNGWDSVLNAAVPAFFSYAGFMLIIEMSGEIKDPGRTLPLGLGISFLTVLLAYTVISLVIVGVIPWSDLGSLSAPVGEVANRIMPSWLAKFIIITAIAAAASSINALILGYSRDVFALAKVQILPKVLAKISTKTDVPFNSILLILLFSMIAIAFGGTIADLATLVVIGMLVLQLALGFSLLFIHKKLPHQYEKASFKLSRKLSMFFSIGLIIFSLLFLGIVVWGNLKIIIIASAYFIIGALYFYFRIVASNKNKNLKLLILKEIENAMS